MNLNNDDFRTMYRAHFPSFIGLSFEIIHPGKKLEENWHIELMADALMDVHEKKTRHLKINVPPRSLKSVVSTICFPSFVAGHDPRKRILILAGTPDLTHDIQSKIARLMQSDRYRDLFPEVEVAPTARELRFSPGGSILFATYSTPIIGRGFDLIIIDDPQSPSQVRDPKKRTEAFDYFISSVLPRLNDRHGSIVLVQQRLHAGDLSGSVGGRDYGYLVIPAIAPRAEVWNTRWGQFKRERGQAICEQRQSALELRTLLAESGAIFFGAQQQQAPYENEKAFVSGSWWAHPPADCDYDRSMFEHMSGSWDLTTILDYKLFRDEPFPWVRHDPNRFSTEHFEKLATFRQHRMFTKIAEERLAIGERTTEEEWTRREREVSFKLYRAVEAKPYTPPHLR